VDDSFDEYPNVDPLLEFLVAMSERDEERERTITLFLSGSIITGTVIDLAEWRQLELGDPDQDQAVLDEVSLRKALSDLEAEKGAARPTKFYHMRNARIVTAAGLIPADGPGLGSALLHCPWQSPASELLTQELESHVALVAGAGWAHLREEAVARISIAREQQLAGMDPQEIRNNYLLDFKALQSRATSAQSLDTHLAAIRASLPRPKRKGRAK
jgi:hypothetical protein